MRSIVAIGGGQIGRPGQPVETTRIDRELLRLAGKTRPRLLFIPTASSDDEGYAGVVRRHFGRRLGCAVDVLELVRKRPGTAGIRDAILGAEIVYVGGGNTLKMMRIWRRLGVDRILRKAYERGTVLSGLSAGAICWFRWGHSDSRRFTNPRADSIRVSGLGFVNALCCPHCHSQKGRIPGLKRMMKKTPGVAIALDNCCAMELVDDRYRIITSRASAHAYRVAWHAGQYRRERIRPDRGFSLLEELLRKRAP